MAFRLKGFRSLWGTPTAERLLASKARHSAGNPSPTAAASYGEKLAAHIAAQGYDGIEASLSDLDLIGGPTVVKELLAKHDMQLIVGVYSGWTDYEDANLSEQFEGVTRHLARYREQLERVCEHFPRGEDEADSPLVWINAHSGSDHWGKLDQMEFIAHALEIETQLEVDNLSHETHRGRIFYSPWPTLELLEAFPSLKLTLDMSHWCVVTERLLDTTFDDTWLQRVMRHVWHVHGRMGTAQSSQIPHLPGHRVVEQEVERFERLWEAIWRHQFSRFHASVDLKDVDPLWKRPFATFTPEYGPIPYAPRDAQEPTREAYDVDALCEQQMDRQRERFAGLMQEKAAEEAAKAYA
ncbi:hypothetical protein Poli38472_013418 [Pythium oligandrum]|uniref:Xylose isomerase-like TIM barrel domain-containing protein n=1 Tax=Pythium oligandrum TaxID=41045 RepID=A0A8K1FEH3_PYTOL|nr:hypothetical protein Poli38472_013418 [Pythium oligandrum]|eukprot:TMW57944.1 hypothetical protein Poli38472_013418 [Pythium oligandrum]